MGLNTIFAVAGLLTGVLGAPAPSPHVLHEKRELPSSEWIRMESVHGDLVLPMRVGLHGSNMDQLHDMLMDVSMHDSPNYGRHYTDEQINDIFAPPQNAVDDVVQWLEAAGVPAEAISQSTNKQWVQFDVKASDAESLFKTKYHVFEHMPSGRTNIACDEYHVPEHLQGHVDYITPGIKLAPFGGLPGPNPTLRKRIQGIGRVHEGPIIRPMPANTQVKAVAAGCDTVVTPQCIQTFYNITPGTTAAKGNQLGIFEDLGDVYAQGDLNDFFSTLYPIIPNGTHPILEGIDGGTAPVPQASAGAESDLDFQISYPIIYPQNSILFQTDDPVYENNYVFQGFLNNFFDGIDGSYCTFSADGETGNSPLDPPYPDPQPGGFKGKLQCGVYATPKVVSISYGGAEADLPISYQRRQCAEIAKLGMKGTTVVVSSGDSGVAGRGGDPTPSNCLGKNNNVFAPQFPATCPYLSAIGATVLPPGGNAKADAEVAVTRFPSGGGFSNIYARSEASYQNSAVTAYFAKNLVNYPFYNSVNNNSFNANGGIYNRNGRGYPDFAAIGDNVAIYNQGKAVLIGGTSASSPVFGAILTRVNEVRIAAGKSTVGFVNPTLYANPQVFNDITVGNNSGCGTPGFIAAKGWDPVTGLGTPNFPAIVKLFSGLP